MSKEIVLKSKKYLDQNNILSNSVDITHDSKKLYSAFIVFGVLLPFVMSMVIGNPVVMICIILTIPATHGASSLFTTTYRQYSSRTRIFKVCGEMGIELTLKEKSDIQVRCNAFEDFDLMLEDNIHKVSVRYIGTTAIFRVTKLQDDVLYQVISDSLSMRDYGISNHVDSSKIFTEKSSATPNIAISNQISSINEELQNNPNFKVTKDLEITMNSKTTDTKYAKLQKLYENELAEKIANRS